MPPCRGGSQAGACCGRQRQRALEQALALGMPWSPMSWTDADPFAVRHYDPSAGGATAGEHQRMNMAPLDHSEFKIAIVGSRRNALPYRFLVHHIYLAGSATGVDQRCGRSS